MKILHFGGAGHFIIPLANYQNALGHQARCAGMWSNFWGLKPLFPNASNPEQLDEICKMGFDIIHFHNCDELMLDDPAFQNQVLSKLSTNAKLILSLGNNTFLHPKKNELLERKIFNIKNYFSHIFISSPPTINLNSLGISYSFLPLWVDTGALKIQPHQEDLPLKALFLADLPFSKGASEIIQAFDQINCKNERMKLKIITAEQAATNFDQALSDVQIVIEGLDLESYSSFGLFAMALGKTLLSGNTTKSQDYWESYKYSPVQHLSRENIKQKLESILLEPRCCRDFSKRSRAFVEKFHDINLSGQLILNTYKKVCETTLREKKTENSLKITEISF